MRVATPRARWTFAVFAAVAGFAFPHPALASPGGNGRGYELVSPAFKDGGDVIVDSSRVRAATSESAGDPMAAMFAVRTGVGDAAGTALSTEYLSVRDGLPGTRGWSTHAISPAQRALAAVADSQGLEAAYIGDVSADLSKGVLQAWSPLTDDPSVAATENLYVRDNIRTPGTGAYQLLTACPLCASAGPLPRLVVASNRPIFAGASTDLSHVVFESTANLTNDATGTSTKLYEWVNGALRMLSGPGNAGCDSAAPCSAAGIGASSFLVPHVISANGSRVIYTSPIGAFDDTPAGGTGDQAAKVYEFDDHGTADPSDDTTVQVNASERTDCAGDPTCGGNGIPDPTPGTPQPAHYEDASADGSRVFFTSTEALTDDAPDNGIAHLYMWSVSPDAQGHHLTRLDVDANPIDVGSTFGVIGASADGHFVYFVANNQLIDNPSLPHDRAAIYLWRNDGGSRRLTFIGYFNYISDADVNINPTLVFPKTARVTPDGHSLLFEASDGTGLTGYDHGTCLFSSTNGVGCAEVYVYNALSGSLLCASCNPSGARATGNAYVTTSYNARPPGGGLTVSTTYLSHAISDDGRRVFFNTAEPLVPEDINGRQDVYEYDTQSRSAHLISSGHDSADSWFLDATPSGSDVFFDTRERLVGWDVDENYDLYDARIGGGFPEPPVRPGCSGDSCQALGGAAPSGLAPGSALLTGAANVKSPSHRKVKHCKRGYVRKRVRGKVRCVKRVVHKRHGAASGRRHATGR